jgi:hypothetical protein
MSGIVRKMNVFNRLVFSLFGGICIVWGLFAVVKRDIGPGLMAIVIGVMGVWFARWVFGRLLAEQVIKEDNPGPSAASSDEDIAHLYDECSSGNIPIIGNPPVNLKIDEIAHHACPVEVRQLKTDTATYRGYAGTRVKIGDLPIYLGGSVPQKVTREVMATVGTGNFVVTNKRVVLSGTQVNYSIKLDQISDLELFSDALQIMNEGRYGGRFYMMEDPRRAAVILEQLIGRFR